MNTWAILGDFEFELLNSPVAFSHTSSSDWVEHSLIQGKSTLEFMGEALDKIELEALFHAHLIDPEEQLRKLQEARIKHEPLTLVMGNGDYRGRWVMTDINLVANKTTADGGWHSMRVSLSLREFTGTFQTAAPEQGVVDEIDLPIDSVNTPPEPKNPQQELSYGVLFIKNLLVILYPVIRLLVGPIFLSSDKRNTLKPHKLELQDSILTEFDAMASLPQVSTMSANSEVTLFQNAEATSALTLGQLARLSYDLEQGVQQLNRFVALAATLPDRPNLLIAGKTALDELKIAQQLLRDSVSNLDLSISYPVKNHLESVQRAMDNLQNEMLLLAVKIATRGG